MTSRLITKILLYSWYISYIILLLFEFFDINFENVTNPNPGRSSILRWIAKLSIVFLLICGLFYIWYRSCLIGCIHFLSFVWIEELPAELWNLTSVGEEYEAFFIRVWKPLPSIHVLKTLSGSPKGKAQRG